MSVWIHLQYYRAPISSNHAQWTRIMKSKTSKRLITRRVSTHEARVFREYVQNLTKIQIQCIPTDVLNQFRSCQYILSRYIFVDRFMQKKHTDIPMKKDVTNLLKSTEDAILEALGQNDKKVFDTVLHKIHTNNEKDARFILSLIGFDQRPSIQDVYKSLSSDWEELIECFKSYVVVRT